MADQQPYGSDTQPKESNTLSIVGIVLGAASFLLCPIGFGIAGIICGVIGRNRGQRLGKTAIIVSSVGLVVGTIIGVIIFTVYSANMPTVPVAPAP